MAEQALDPHDTPPLRLGPLLDRLELLLGEVEELEPAVRDRVFELLDGVDAVHRMAITRLADTLGKVTFGVASIAHRVEPVKGLVGEINGDLITVADALEALAADLRPAAVRAS